MRLRLSSDRLKSAPAGRRAAFSNRQSAPGSPHSSTSTLLRAVSAVTHLAICPLHRSIFSKLDTPVPPFRFGLFAASPTPHSSLPSSDARAYSPVYRGSLPKPANLPFLSTLRIRTVISLTPKSLASYEEAGELPVRTRRAVSGARRGEDDEDESEEGVGAWVEREAVRVVHVKVGKAKDGAIPFGTEAVKRTLEVSRSQADGPSQPTRGHSWLLARC